MDADDRERDSVARGVAGISGWLPQDAAGADADAPGSADEEPGAGGGGTLAAGAAGRYSGPG